MSLRINGILLRTGAITLLVGAMASFNLEAKKHGRDASSKEHIKERNKRYTRDRTQSKPKKGSYILNEFPADKDARRYRDSSSTDEMARDVDASGNIITSGYDKTSDPLSESAIDAVRRNSGREADRSRQTRPTGMEFNHNKNGRLQ